ncbi:hypothetical protein BJX99DRAFT_230571 [Aspergillus californicus]
MADADTGDRILCHACGRVWPQSQHGLNCPHCSSEFTEIIEIPPDTEDPEPPHPDPPETFPGHRSPSPAPVNPWADSNPFPTMNANTWATRGGNDAESQTGPRFTQRTYRSPGGNVFFQSTIRTQGFPVRGAGQDVDPMMQGMDSFFQSITELNRERAARAQHRSPGVGAGARNRTSIHHPASGLFPRDADGPQPMGTPLRSLGDILDLFHTQLAQPQDGGPTVRMSPPGAPLALLTTLLTMERNGDAVYSQEELDRVITQLVEHTGNRSAAPPASQDSIRSLPKQAADQELLGTDGTAECSICMDSVKVGDEVTVLPCTHWFHPHCIEMWLNQHNTCPHCRRGVGSTASGATTAAPSEGTSDQSSRSDSFSFSVHQPFTFGEDRAPDVSRTGRNEGSGGWTGWVRSRFGGGSQ